MLHVVDSVNDPGRGRDSEDRIGSGPERGLAWAIDGATDVCADRLFPAAPSDAFWFAGQADALLQTGAAAPPRDIVADLIDGLAAAVTEETGQSVTEIAPGDMPSAALTLMQWDSGSGALAFCGFADCTSLIRRPHEAPFAVPKPPSPLDEQAQARRLLSDGSDIDAALRAQRAMMNRPGGYWVLSVHAEALSGLHCYSTQAPAGTRVLLCTDGFYRLVEMYGLFDDAGLFEAAERDGLAALTARLRGFESDAADDIRFGRFKTSDDAAALLVELI